jgi:hypothetical protein
MKATLFSLLVVGCTGEHTQQPITIAHVEVSNVNCRSDCESALELYGVCTGHFDRVEPETGHVDVETVVAANHIAQLVQLQYRGAVTNGDRPHLDYVLERGGAVDVTAAFDPGVVLYRIDASGAVADVDRTRLASAAGRMLRFAYPADAPTVVENHVIDKPRSISIDAGETFPFCCSIGHPSGAGLVLVALLFARRARRGAQVVRRSGRA